MQYVYPDYYKKFNCISSECKHNCCIGWEIDIDSETLDYYSSVGGEIGKRLKENISYNDVPHFILSKNDRCPFLNENNLCDIITDLGEESLCDICYSHPRFYNEFSGRTEVGLGLCCEAAAKLILGQKHHICLKSEENLKSADKNIILRDKLIKILQNGDKSIIKRCEEMLDFLNIRPLKTSIDKQIDFLLSLERLDKKWTKTLITVKESHKTSDFDSFDKYMADRQIEYEQLLVYFIYRHFASASEESEIKASALFAVFGYTIIHAIGAVIFSQKGKYTFENQVEITRMFSAEIEYSEDNFKKILNMLKG